MEQFQVALPDNRVFFFPPVSAAQHYVRNIPQGWAPKLIGVAYVETAPATFDLPNIGKTDFPHTGIYAYEQDMLFPKKGFPFPQALDAIDKVKRQTMLFTSLANKWMVLPALAFLLIPKQARRQIADHFITHYCREAEAIINTVKIGDNYHTVLLKDAFMTNFARTAKLVMTRFLTALGLSEGERLARILAHLPEYDDIYRFRLQDLCSETTKDKLLADPRGEIVRLAQIYRQREELGDFSDTAEIGRKFLAAAKLLSFVLLIPSVRKAFTVALKDIDFSLLQLDEADRYHCLMKGGYAFGGLSTEQKKERFLALHHGILPEVILLSQTQ